MKSNALTLTIVIPVFNEENYLKACLDAISKQTTMPLEVIVVDNNSVDKTVEIARSYDFVKVLYEKRQGQTFAQANGFAAAKGEILGRLDADTILPKDWVEKVLAKFEKDQQTVAITGDGSPYDAPLKSFAAGVFRFYHSRISHVVSGQVMLWGANTALRAESWKKIAHEMSYRTDVWEDYEMSFLLSKIGKVKHVRGIKIGCSFRAVHRPLFPQLAYQYRAIRTFRLFNGRVKTTLFFIFWYSMVLLIPAMVINRLMWKLQHPKD